MAATKMVAFESTWTNPDESEANIAWARNAHDAMKQLPSGGIYLNFPGFADEQEDKSRSAYGPNYERLREIKTKHDLNNLFRMNHNIPPSA